jgi:hypothetical protein
MSELTRVDIHRSAIEPRHTSLALKRKVAIFTLIAVIIFVMIVWFGVLGWGAVEVLRQVIAIVKSIWSSYA